MRSKTGYGDESFGVGTKTTTLNNKTRANSVKKMGTKNKENGMDTNNENSISSLYKKYD